MFNCQSLGCPSLMLSPDTKLGVSLHVKWELVRQRLAQGKQLRLVYSLPALWSDTLAQLLVSAGKEHPDFLIVLQMEVDVTSVQRLRRLGLKVRSSQVKLFVSAEDWIETMKSYDLAICARIHGSMAAIAASIPAVVIATDSRIEELAKRMNIPTVRHLVLKAHMTLNAFLKHFVDFNGVSARLQAHVSTNGNVLYFQAMARSADGMEQFYLLRLQHQIRYVEFSNGFLSTLSLLHRGRLFIVAAIGAALSGFHQPHLHTNTKDHRGHVQLLY